MGVFYVYEWFNTDSEEVFYVGKGTKNRYKNTSQRNNYFKNYFNKHSCDVRKVLDNLLEEDALKLEIRLIEHYQSINQCQTNLTKGGEGSTFPEGSWGWFYQRLHAAWYLEKYTNDIRRFDPYEYHPYALKTKTTLELEDMYDEYEFSKTGNRMWKVLTHDTDWYDEFFWD